MVNQPLSARSVSDPVWLLLYVSLAYFVLSNGGEEDVASDVSKFVGWLKSLSPYTAALSSIPEVVVQHPGVLLVSVLSMTVSTAIFLKVAEFMLRPLLYLMVVGWAVTVVYTVINVPNMAMTMIPPIFALRYVWQYRASFQLQITLYQEAIVATIAHPILPLIVPIFEGAFYLFQIEMSTRFVDLEWKNWTSGLDSASEQQYKLWALRIFIPWTLQSGSAYFEMMCASVMGRYYYRDSNSSSNTIGRTVNGVLGVLLFQPGTAIGFGFMGLCISFLQRVHAKMSEQYDKLEWCNPLHLLPKIFLGIIKYLVAWIIFYFQAMHRSGISYAGMTGESMIQSVGRASTVMGTDGALVLSEHAGTSKLSAVCVSASATLATGIMYYAWDDLKEMPNFYGGEAAVGVSEEMALKGICLVCMLSMAASTIQVLSRASNAIMLCALDEMAHDANQLRHAPARLKASIQEYMSRKSSFPSGFWTFFVMLLFAGSCVALDVLQGKGKIEEQQHVMLVLVSMALAILL